MTTDDIGQAVRSLVRVVMGMPDDSVRPADQLAPAGAQTAEMATVKIITSEDVGRVARAVESDPEDEDASIEALEVPMRFVASVQFFRGPTKDATGAAKYSTAAFNRAIELGQRLQLSSSVETMARMNLCLNDIGGARNLADLADANWESRGHVDLTFTVIKRITAPIQTITTVPVTVALQDGEDGEIETRTFEVTS